MPVGERLGAARRPVLAADVDAAGAERRDRCRASRPPRGRSAARCATARRGRRSARRASGRSTTNDTTRTNAEVDDLDRGAGRRARAAAAAATAPTLTNTEPKCGNDTSTIAATIASASQASAGHSNNASGGADYTWGEGLEGQRDRDALSFGADVGHEPHRFARRGRRRLCRWSSVPCARSR